MPSNIPTDRQCLVAVRAYESARSYLQTFHYTPYIVIRDLRKPVGFQEIWRGKENETRARNERVEIECMKEAIVAANTASPSLKIVDFTDECVSLYDDVNAS